MPQRLTRRNEFLRWKKRVSAYADTVRCAIYARMPALVNAGRSKQRAYTSDNL